MNVLLRASAPSATANFASSTRQVTPVVLTLLQTGGTPPAVRALDLDAASVQRLRIRRYVRSVVRQSAENTARFHRVRHLGVVRPRFGVPAFPTRGSPPERPQRNRVRDFSLDTSPRRRPATFHRATFQHHGLLTSRCSPSQKIRDRQRSPPGGQQPANALLRLQHQLDHLDHLRPQQIRRHQSEREDHLRVPPPRGAGPPVEEVRHLEHDQGCRSPL